MNYSEYQEEKRQIFYFDQKTRVLKTVRKENLGKYDVGSECDSEMTDCGMSESDITEYRMRMLEDEKPERFQSIPNTLLFWRGMRVIDGSWQMQKMKTSDFWKSRMCKMALTHDWYGGGAKYYKARDVIEEFAGKSYYTVKELVEDNFEQTPADAQTLDAACEIFARHARGAAFFVDGMEWEEKNNGANGCKKVWRKVELPALMQNKKIDLIVELDFFEPEKVRELLIKNELTEQSAREYGLPEQIACRAGQNMLVEFMDGKIRFTRVDGMGEPVEEQQVEESSREPLTLAELLKDNGNHSRYDDNKADLQTTPQNSNIKQYGITKEDLLKKVAGKQK